MGKRQAYFWFRRDLRLSDNKALHAALAGHESVQCVFIFDNNILDELPQDDARLTFIHQQLSSINAELGKYQSSLLIRHGDPLEIWQQLLQKKEFDHLHFNEDFEPYATERDEAIRKLAEENGVDVHTYIDHILFKPGQILKDNGTPYTVFTPFKKKYLSVLAEQQERLSVSENTNFSHLTKSNYAFPSLSDIGFEKSSIVAPDYIKDYILDYDQHRNNPDVDRTTRIGHHLRFGTVSVRKVMNYAIVTNQAFLNELLWREFFIHIMALFPNTINQNFKPQYNGIEWRNNSEEFQKWCEGKTGYPLVDAGMRELNQTGFMHNRVRMVVASFLTKHLLIDWRWGEAYFAEKLLDFELASNNGNWQWAAGTGCDAAPYFRVFNPISQQEKFDPDFVYCKRWIPDFDSNDYIEPIVDHKMARERAIQAYKTALEQSKLTF